MNTKVRVSNQPQSRVTVSNQPQGIAVATNVKQKLSALGDVDALTAQHGALLQYDAINETWVASNTIESTGLTINCGNY